MMTGGQYRGLIVLVALLAAMVGGLSAANAASGKSKMNASIDTETRDTAVQLRQLQQELAVTQQYLYLSLFRQQYAGKITADRLTIANRDGGAMPVYIFSPATLDSARKYPGLVVLHGSYHGALTPNAFGMIAAAVTHGYIVIFPEYRGSRGYGEIYYDAIDYGGKEIDDVIAAADYLAQSRPVPRDRIGIYGRSKGGMMVLLAIQRFPKSFKAAVDVVGLTDMVAYMAYKPEYRRKDVAKQPRFKGKHISKDVGPYMDVSPLNHVDSIRTPLLIHSTSGDKTAPVRLHGGRLIEVLKAHKIPYEAKIYDHAPGGHIYSELDTTQARDSEQRIFEFLGRYLRPQAANP